MKYVCYILKIFQKPSLKSTLKINLIQNTNFNTSKITANIDKINETKLTKHKKYLKLHASGAQNNDFDGFATLRSYNL